MTNQEREDQRAFDKAVNRKGKIILQFLAGIAIVASFMMSMVALVQSGNNHEIRVSAPAAVSTAIVNHTPVSKIVDVKIIPEYKKGPEGKKHDAFTITNFKVEVSKPTTLRIDNTDEAPHSITSPEAGVNIIAQPGIHVYKLIINKKGKFRWYCMLPCDNWAMQNLNFMSGYIIAT